MKHELIKPEDVRMTIHIGKRPPHWADLLKAFPGVDVDKVVVTYGDEIFMPANTHMYPDLRVHEGVHVGQQTAMGKTVWWDRYLVDTQFRFEQEAEAYRRQYVYMQQNQKDRLKLARFLVELSNQLSGPMYGDMVSYPVAMRMIRLGK